MLLVATTTVYVVPGKGKGIDRREAERYRISRFGTRTRYRINSTSNLAYQVALSIAQKLLSDLTSGIWKGFSRPNEVQWVGGYIKYMALEFLEICLEFFF